MAKITKNLIAGADEKKLKSKSARYNKLIKLSILALFTFQVSCPRAPLPPDETIRAKIPDYIKTVKNPASGFESELDELFLSSFNRGWDMLQSGEVGKAEDIFEQIKNSKPGFYPVWAGLGYVAMYREEYYDSQKYFTEALKIKKDYLPSLLGTAVLYRVMGEKLKAYNLYGLILEKYPGQPEANMQYNLMRLQETDNFLMLARRYRQEKKFKPAFENYKRALNYAGKEDFIYAEVGTFLMDNNEFKEAIPYLQTATNLSPNNQSYLKSFALALENAGKFDQAKTYYRRVLDLNPSDSEVRIAIERVTRKISRAGTGVAGRDISAEKQVTRAQAALYIDNNFKFKSKAAERDLIITDILDHPDRESIISMVNRGIFEVYPNHTFAPRTALTRIEMALLINRLIDAAERDGSELKISGSGIDVSISDISLSSPSYRVVKKVVQLGIIPLKGGLRFDPGEIVSGKEFVLALDRLSNLIQ